MADNLKVARTDCLPLRSADDGKGKDISSIGDFFLFLSILHNLFDIYAQKPSFITKNRALL
jgi:hypothetical protein